MRRALSSETAGEPEGGGARPEGADTEFALKLEVALRLILKNENKQELQLAWADGARRDP